MLPQVTASVMELRLQPVSCSIAGIIEPVTSWEVTEQTKVSVTLTPSTTHP